MTDVQPFYVAGRRDQRRHLEVSTRTTVGGRPGAVPTPRRSSSGRDGRRGRVPRRPAAGAVRADALIHVSDRLAERADEIAQPDHR